MEEHLLTQKLQQRLRFSTRIQEAQAVLIAITNENNPKVLLTRRSIHMNNHAGRFLFRVANVTLVIQVILL